FAPALDPQDAVQQSDRLDGVGVVITQDAAALLERLVAVTVRLAPPRSTTDPLSSVSVADVRPPGRVSAPAHARSKGQGESSAPIAAPAGLLVRPAALRSGAPGTRRSAAAPDPPE